MELLEAIRTRRSIGNSTGDVPRETITELIEAATWAPNHKLTQPWHFTVVNRRGARTAGRSVGARGGGRR